MKPYGIPRTLGTLAPDVADLILYGAKSRKQRMRSRDRRESRLIWKRAYRRSIRLAILGVRPRGNGRKTDAEAIFRDVER